MKLNLLETAEMRFLRAVAGCIMTNHKRNEDVKEELGIAEQINIIKGSG
jgi:hypothetical protein